MFGPEMRWHTASPRMRRMPMMLPRETFEGWLLPGGAPASVANGRASDV